MREKERKETSMKVNGKEMVLSRRNLEALLAKLDGHPPGSACTIVGGSDAEGWTVRAEENGAHYADRPAGMMVADTEIHITKPGTGVTSRIFWRDT
jgi:hypothetical protein